MKYVYLDKPEYNPETQTLSPDYKIEDGVFIAGWKVENLPDEDGYIPSEEEQPGDAPTLRSRLDMLEEALELLLSGATE